VVIGTRPEAIKLAPVIDALSARGLNTRLIFTGQHPELAPADYGLGCVPAIFLRCPGQDDPHAHVGMVSKAMAAALVPDPPALVVVQGDTSSALGGALAAGLARVPLAHIEAGLRSHDLKHPWPEEEFRVAIDQASGLLFAPTELSATNLRRERVRGRIHVTGNSGIDAVLAVRAGLSTAVAERSLPRLLVTCHRRENWGSAVAGIAAALRRIESRGIAEIEMLLHPNPSLAAQVRALLADRPAIRFRPPCGHRETVAAMVGADLVLSDSGGMQEEAAALGVPLLVLRERTERPEAIACGNIELVGTCPDKIVSAVCRRLACGGTAGPALPFGDGRASRRIAAVIEDWLAERGALSPRMASVPRTAQ